MGNFTDSLKKKGPGGIPIGIWAAITAVGLYLLYRWYKNNGGLGSGSSSNTSTGVDTSGIPTTPSSLTNGLGFPSGGDGSSGSGSGGNGGSSGDGATGGGKKKKKKKPKKTKVGQKGHKGPTDHKQGTGGTKIKHVHNPKGKSQPPETKSKKKKNTNTKAKIIKNNFGGGGSVLRAFGLKSAGNLSPSKKKSVPTKESTGEAKATPSAQIIHNHPEVAAKAPLKKSSRKEKAGGHR